MACTYLAPNGRPSNLYDSAVAKYNKQTALSIFTFAQTKTFKTQFKDAELDTNGEPTLDYLEKNNLVGYIPDFALERETDKKVLEDKIDRVTNAFLAAGVDIVVESDIEMEDTAKVMTKHNRLTIKFNPEKAKKDSIFHEAGHAYIDMMGGVDNAFIQKGIEQVKGTKLWKDIKRLYPELNETLLAKEVLTTAIGIEASKLYDSEQKRKDWKFWINRLFQKIAELFGVEPNVAQTLAKDLVNGKLEQNIDGRIKILEQKQKDFRLINNVFQTKQEFVEKAKEAIAKKIDIYYSQMKEAERLRSPNYEALRELETALTTYAKTNTDAGIIAFLNEAYKQTGFLEERLFKMLNPTAQEIADGKGEFTAKDIQNIQNYNATFSLIEDINDLAQQDLELRERIKELDLLPKIAEINTRYDNIRKQTKRMSIKLLSNALVKRNKGRGIIEAQRREFHENAFKTLHIKEFKAASRFKPKELAALKDKMRQYVNGRINIEKDEIAQLEVERIAYLLQQTNQDISYLDRMFIDGDALNDELINIAQQMLDEVDFKIMTKFNEEFIEANKLFTEFEKAKPQSNQEEKYEEMIQDGIEYKDGKIIKTGKKTANLVSKHYAEFYQIRDMLWRQYVEAKENNQLVEIAYDEYMDFILENTKSVYTDDYYNTLNSLSPEAESVVKELKEERKHILSKYRVYKYEDGKYASIYDASKITEIEQQRLDTIEMKLKWAKSIYNEDGSIKTGKDLAIAKELSEYEERVAALYDESVTAEEVFNEARDKAAARGEEALATFMANNTQTVATQDFWDELNRNLSALNSKTTNKALKEERKMLLAPYKKKDGTINAEAVPAVIKERLREIESQIQQIEEVIETMNPKGYMEFVKTGNLVYREYGDIESLPDHIKEPIMWIKENMVFTPTAAYEKAKAEAMVKGEEEYYKWFQENHDYDYYSGFNPDNTEELNEFNSVPLSIWTQLTPPSHYTQVKPNSNWNISRVKAEYLTGVSDEEHGEPTDKWVNPQWTKLQELSEKGNPIGKMYDYLTNRIIEDDKALPEWAKLSKTIGTSTFYRLPSVVKSGLERHMKDGVLNTIGKNFQLRNKKNNDTEFGGDAPLNNTEIIEGVANFTGDTNSIAGRTVERVINIMTNEAGEEKNKVPVNFRYEIPFEDQSFDLMTIMLMNNFMSMNYEEKNNIAADLELTRDLMAERDVVKTRGTTFEGVKYLGDKLINNNREDFTPTTKKGIDSNSYKAFKSMLEDRLYGVSTLGNIATNKVVNRLLSYTGNVMLIGNYLSAGANFIYGDFTNWIEAAGGEFFTAKNMKNAHFKYGLELFNGAIVGDIGARVYSSKTNLLIEKFNMLGDWSAIARKFVEDNKFKRLFKGSSAHALNNSAEHAIQSMLMYAAMDNIKVMNENGEYLTETGTTTDINKAMSLDEAYKVKDNKLILDPRVAKTTFDESMEVGQDLEFLVSRYMRDLNAYMQGQYSSQKKSEIQRYWYGSAIMMLRKWLPRGLKRRWRGISTVMLSKDQLTLDDRFYSRPLRAFQEGYYTTLGRFVYQLVSQGKSLKWEMITTDWAMLTEGEQANIKKATMELVSATIMLVLASALKGLGDDEEDEATKRFYFTMAYFALRLEKELFTYVNPVEVTKTLKSPSAGMIMIDRALHLLNQLSSDTWGVLTGAGPEYYKTGRRKGELKLWKDIQDMTPLIKNFDRDIEEALTFLFNARI